jgi:hypothetical protein
MFIDAFLYPIRQGGWIMIVAGALLSVILSLANHIVFVGLFAAIVSAGYFGSFYLDIVSTTMTGRKDVPEWPSFNNFWDDIFSPFCRLVFLVALSFGPLIYLVYFANHKADWFEAAFWGAVAYGCLYFPMSVLSTQAFGGIGAALPHIVFPGIFRALPSYLSAVLVLAVVFFGLHYGRLYVVKVPYAGWFLTAAVSLYAMMFQGRLIGLIYEDKREALGWE